MIYKYILIYVFLNSICSINCTNFIWLDNKVAVYKAVILTVLLYGSETWTIYRQQIAKLDQFHMRCLRRIAHVKWHDKVQTTEVLQTCGVTGIEVFLVAALFRWAGQVVCMSDLRLPKQVFYGRLQSGTCSQGGQFKHYKDGLKSNLKLCNMDPNDLEKMVTDKTSWRAQYHAAIHSFESKQITAAVDKRRR